MVTRRQRTRLLVAVIAVLAALPVARAGEKITLVGPWTRQVGTAEPVEFGVPASFEPIGGVSTYVRKFTIDFEIPESVALLHFDGIAGSGTFWLNGVLLGEHGPFTPFEFEVSAFLRPVGVENELVVEIDDHRDEHTIPFEDSPWVGYAGIIRNVYIQFAHKCAVLRARVQYTFGDAEYSTVIGEVNVDLVGKPGVAAELFGGVLDGEPGVWDFLDDLETESPIIFDESGRASVSLPFFVINPELWSPDNPKLYYLWVGATVDGLIVDESLDRIGFRDIAVEKQDILLNGKPIFLKGMCRHDIYGSISGFSGSPEEMENDMIALKLMGVNYVRLIHYPHTPRILELADELGLLVSCEVPAWANFADPAVREKLYVMYEEMIVRDMNHPAVFMWLSGNSRARPMPYAKEAQELAKRLDRNRLASYVIDNDEYDPAAVDADVAFIEEAGLDVYMKVTFWLYYLEFLQDAWTNFPKDVPIVIAELGFEGNDREPVIVTPEGDLFEVSERQQVSAVKEMLEGWRPHLPFYAEEHISGLAMFNWQDIQWPDIRTVLPNHVPSLHFGMVYEDRTEKEVVSTVADFYKTMPTEFVGLATVDDADVEELFGDAQNLSQRVNQLNRDSGPSVSSSGNRIYYASDGPDFVTRPKLMVTDLLEGVWQEGRLLDIPQEAETFAFRRSPCISYDERTLYFTRALLSGIFVAQTRIWESKFVNGRWHSPEDMGDVINHADAIGVTSDPSISADGNTLYLSSDRPGSHGGTDLWVAENIDGEWQFPLNLGAPVNSIYNDAEPSISADGNTLYFTSGRPGGVGSSDIWVSRKVNGEWTEPKNLGPRVNSTGSDREPELSKDGNSLYFTGIRDGGEGLSDIWFAKVPGAPDPSDISSAVSIEVSSNNPGTVVVVTPSDVEHLGDGVADPSLARRFRMGTPVTLAVAPTFNGLSFMRWTVDGEAMPEGDNDLSFTLNEPVNAEAVYAIPESVVIDGAETLTFSGGSPSQSTETYVASVRFMDASARAVRSGVTWSVDDETVATIDESSGTLTPRPMDGSAVVTVSARVHLAGFDLPVATKTLRLEGVVTPESAGTSGAPAPCGVIGMGFLFLSIAGRFALGLVSHCGKERSPAGRR